MISLTEHYIRDSNGFGFSIKNPYDDCPDRVRHCLMHIQFLRHSWWFKIPQLFKPKSKWVDLSNRDWATPGADGKKGYTEYIRREYGFSLSKEALHVYYGIQPGCWSSRDKKNSDHTKVFFLPWNEMRRVRYDFYNLDGSYFCSADNRPDDRMDFESIRKAEQEVPKAVFMFNDFDGEEIEATCHICEMEWRQGVKLFKWLRYIVKPIIERSLSISFNKEVGYEKGSWKGGTMGHSIKMLPNETPLEAFKRYGSAEDRYKSRGIKCRGFTNIKEVAYEG